MNLALIMSRLGISPEFTQDITLFAMVALASFVFGMFIGRYKLITILINIYVAYAVTMTVPAQYFNDYLMKLLFFLALAAILTIVSKRLFEVYFSGSGSGFLWRVFLMSFLEVVFLISVVLSMLPSKVALRYVSSQAYGYLASDLAVFVWMLAPMVALFVIHKRLNR